MQPRILLKAIAGYVFVSHCLPLGLAIAKEYIWRCSFMLHLVTLLTELHIIRRTHAAELQ
jgi:hypothetical protein